MPSARIGGGRFIHMLGAWDLDAGTGSSYCGERGPASMTSQRANCPPCLVVAARAQEQLFGLPEPPPNRRTA